MHKKLICGMLTGIIAASCLTAVPVSADTVYKGNFESFDYPYNYNPHLYTVSSYSTYDINRDGKVNVFDAVCMRNTLTGGYTNAIDILERNQKLEDVKNTVEQYIKDHNSSLISNLSHISVNGFCDAAGKLTNNFQAVVKFSRRLSREEIRSVCINRDSLFEDALVGELYNRLTEPRYLRISIVNGIIETVVPSENGDNAANKKITTGKPSVSSYDINRNSTVDVADLVSLQTFLKGGDVSAPVELNNNKAVDSAITKVIDCINTVAPNVMLSDIRAEAFMNTPGVIERNFLITCTVDFMSQHSADDIQKLCKNAAMYSEDNCGTSDNCHTLCFAVIDDTIQSVSFADTTEFDSEHAYSAETAIAIPYSGKLSSTEKGKTDVADVAVKARNALNAKSGVLCAKITNITGVPDSPFANKDVMVYFDAPLTESELAVLLDYSSSSDSESVGELITRCRDKAARAQVHIDNDICTFYPLI